MRKSRIALPLLAVATTFVLIGCGGGSSSSTTTASPTKLLIDNQTTSDFARVEFDNTLGVITASQSFVCQSKLECVLGVDSDFTIKASTLLFYDKNSRLVAAYTFDPTVDDDNLIQISPATLGLYLFDQIKSKYDWPADVLNMRISQLFSKTESPDGLADEFEEMGLYYDGQTRDGGLGLNAFLESINQKLDNSEILDAAAIGAPVNDLHVKSVAMSSNPATASGVINCPEKTATFAGVLQKLAGLIPYAPVQKALSGAVSAIDSGCGTRVANTIGNVRKDLAELKAKLDLMDKELKAVGLEMSSWRQTSQWQSANSAYDDMLNHLVDIKSLNNIYANYLFAKNVTSLTEHLKVAGLSKTVLKNDSILAEIFSSDTLKKLNSSLAWLESTKGLTTIKSALVEVCTNQNNMTTEVVSTRNRCNVYASETVAEYVSAWNTTTAMIRDIAQALDTANATGSEKVEVANPFDQTQWYSANASDNTVFKAAGVRLTDALDKLSVEMNGAFIDTFNGLNSDLQSKLVARNCVSNSLNTGGKLPGIVEWYAYRSSTKYLITSCNSTGYGNNLLSRYDYETFNGDVSNVLGAIVNKSVFTQKQGASKGFTLGFSSYSQKDALETLLVVSGGKVGANNRPYYVTNTAPDFLVDDTGWKFNNGANFTDYSIDSINFSTKMPINTWYDPSNFMGIKLIKNHQSYVNVWMHFLVYDARGGEFPDFRFYRTAVCLHGGCKPVQGDSTGELRFDTGVTIKGSEKQKSVFAYDIIKQ